MLALPYFYRRNRSHSNYSCKWERPTILSVVFISRHNIRDSNIIKCNLNTNSFNKLLVYPAEERRYRTDTWYPWRISEWNPSHYPSYLKWMDEPEQHAYTELTLEHLCLKTHQIHAIHYRPTAKNCHLFEREQLLCVLCSQNFLMRRNNFNDDKWDSTLKSAIFGITVAPSLLFGFYCGAAQYRQTSSSASISNI